MLSETIQASLIAAEHIAERSAQHRAVSDLHRMIETAGHASPVGIDQIGGHHPDALAPSVPAWSSKKPQVSGLSAL